CIRKRVENVYGRHKASEQRGGVRKISSALGVDSSPQLASNRSAPMQEAFTWSSKRIRTILLLVEVWHTRKTEIGNKALRLYQVDKLKISRTLILSKAKEVDNKVNHNANEHRKRTVTRNVLLYYAWKSLNRESWNGAAVNVV
ncbi:hypothetical protein V1477_015967, partial [Vespula maculifrons]